MIFPEEHNFPNLPTSTSPRLCWRIPDCFGTMFTIILLRKRRRRKRNRNITQYKMTSGIVYNNGSNKGMHLLEFRINKTILLH